MPPHFETVKSFADVPIRDEGVETSDFLEASTGLVDMFDLLGNGVFGFVQNDLRSNIAGVKLRYDAHTDTSETLEKLVITEAQEGVRIATACLVRLIRGLAFTCHALMNVQADRSAELHVCFKRSYDIVLRHHHSFVIRSVVLVTCNPRVPYRHDFYTRIAQGGSVDKLDEEMAKWLVGLEAIVTRITAFLLKGNYGKNIVVRYQRELAVTPLSPELKPSLPGDHNTSRMSNASFSAKAFKISCADPEDVEGRAVRRVLVSPDALKGTKLCAGDPVALTVVRSKAADSGPLPFAVGALWPLSELSADAVHVSPSLLFTLRTTEGSQVRIFPLASQSPKSAPWIPSLRFATEAGSIRLREVDATGNPLPPLEKSAKEDKGKRRDWLTLLVRETLVDLKYTTRTQIVQVRYEGSLRYFAPIFVTLQNVPTADPISDLSKTLDALAVDDLPPLSTVGWDTSVVIEDRAKASQKMQTPHLAKQSIEALDPSSSATAPDAYSLVGGLDKQIAQIRDLIEIPLTRPDLFRHFGLKPPRGLLLHGPPGTAPPTTARPKPPCGASSQTHAPRRPASSCSTRSTRSVRAREDSAGGEVEKRVVATLLTEMDGVEGDGEEDVRVVVVATTNRPNAIDPALRRPGRFDREIEIGIPDVEARISILNVLLSKTPHEVSDEQLRAVASRAHGYVGADLAAVVREAGTTAIKRYLALSPTTPGTPQPHSHLPSPTPLRLG
ncbi:hypothetical protein EVG20_g7635, partial [Dentipellis fragilis]